MPKLSSRMPKYCKKTSGGICYAVTYLGGRTVPLGRYDTKASRVQYDKVVAEWLANGRRPERLAPDDGSDGLTVSEVILAFWKHAEKYYRGSRELSCLQESLRPLRIQFGKTLAANFGPRQLEQIREWMIGQGHARSTINARIARIKRCMKWAAGRQLIPVAAWNALDVVQGLHKGRSDARETDKVGPAPLADVEAVLPHLPMVVGDMCRLQLLLGCRPGELCIMRPCDIDRSGDVWTFKPVSHKTQYRGLNRLIFLGPRAQEIIRPYLLRDSQSCCFSPLDSERKRTAAMRDRRKTKVQPSQQNRSKARRARPPRDHYTTNTYSRAIRRACESQGVPRWSVNQLRHLAAVQIQQRFGPDAARTTLGHASVSTTEVYLERDVAMAKRVAREVG